MHGPLVVLSLILVETGVSTRLPGRLIPPTRIFAEDCVREIMRTVVAMNMRDGR